MATAKQKARQRAAQKEEGGRQISAQFTAEDVALLERVKELNPNLSQKELIISGLEMLSRSKMTRAQVLAYIEQNLR